MAQRQIVRLARTFRLECGPLRARGAPAVVLAASAVVVAAGLARALRDLVPRLPEVLRETRALLETTGRARGSLPPAP